MRPILKSLSSLLSTIALLGPLTYPAYAVEASPSAGWEWAVGSVDGAVPANGEQAQRVCTDYGVYHEDALWRSVSGKLIRSSVCVNNGGPPILLYYFTVKLGKPAPLYVWHPPTRDLNNPKSMDALFISDFYDPT